MKKFILISLLLMVSCSKNQNQEQPSITSPKEGSADIIKKDLFDCDSNKCFQSVVAITSNDKVCTGVVDNGLILTNTNCLKALDLSNISIFDIDSNKYKISSTKPYSEDNLITAIQTTEDISELNSNIAILDRENLGVNSVRIDLLNEKFIQEKMDCSITVNSINALNATKINSQTLAIKDCDNLREDSIILQNEELVSLVTTSDVLNLSKSIACGEECDDSYEDKLKFLMREISKVSKVNVSKRLYYSESFNNKFSHEVSIYNNELKIVKNVFCFRIFANLTSRAINTESKYNKYGEVISSEPKFGKTVYYHLDSTQPYSEDFNLIQVGPYDHLSRSSGSPFRDSTYYLANASSEKSNDTNNRFEFTTFLKSCHDTNTFFKTKLGLFSQ